MRLHFLTMPLLASTCMFAPDNLRSFAPMFRDFGLNPKKTSHNMNETKKTEKEEEGELSNIGSPCCQESKAKEEKVEKTDNVRGLEGSKTAGQTARENSLQATEAKDPRQREKLQKTTDHRLHTHTREGKATGEKERRRRRRRRSKERQRRRRRHEKKRQQLNNKEKGRTRLNNNVKNNKEKGKRLNNNKKKNNKQKEIIITRMIPLCLVRCLTANLMHPAHCHVLCS